MGDIKLFSLHDNDVTELIGKSMTVEKALQKMIEDNLETFLGIKFLGTEYRTGPKHGGRIDTLGIYENNSPVIIEYKRATNENVINQGLFYLEWLLDHKAAAPEQNTESSEATGGSTKEQFLAAGGTEAMWQNIVMPESSGDPNAVNELGYKGLGQTKESWGTGSVEEQTEGMINYAQERYGSIDAAMEFRAANNWW